MPWTSSAETARFRAAMEQQQRKALAKRLKELRVYKGWSEADLRQQSGVSVETISRLENAKTKEPREHTLLSLAKAFKMTREELAGPRATPEEMDRAYEGELGEIRRQLARLDLLVIRLLDPPDPEALEREIDAALQRAETSSASSGASGRSRRRRDAKPR
jgi:transcriptional regulator with XRE-family HTH domain